MATRWRLRPFDQSAVEGLGKAASIPPLIAHLLINRGMTTSEQARRFFDARLTALHDPETLPGAIEAAARIHSAILGGRKIVIYGDYDVDGVCGTSLLWSCLKLAGAKHVDYYIPHRVEEGYGLNGEALTYLAKERGAELVVTVDCGISAVKEALLARELGLELIITDHHHIGGTLPEADVLVHPRLPGSTYPFGDLCGCGVALKLAWQVAKGFGDGKKASPHLREFLMESIVLVALATVADVMPLHDENRLLVAHGLKTLAKSPTIGLKALLEVSGLHGSKTINAGHVGFKLAPRINAAGRLERAMIAVEMLTTDDTVLAGELASKLDECNTERQRVEKEITAEARQMVEEAGSIGDRGAFVIGREGWHSGVIGIVASRLVESYHRPTIVVALRDGHGQGSARSVPTFNLYDAIHACSEGLTGFGGHSAAAGLKLPSTLLPGFADRFDNHCRSTLTDDQKQKALWIDAEVALPQLDVKLVESIDAMEPHGIGNPKPIVQVSGVRIVGEPKPVGDGTHLRFRIAQTGASVGCIAWKAAEKWKNLSPGTLCDLVGTPGINAFNGRREVQIEVKDLRVVEGASRN